MARVRVSKRADVPDETAEAMRMLADESRPGEFPTDVIARLKRERDEAITRARRSGFVDRGQF